MNPLQARKAAEGAAEKLKLHKPKSQMGFLRQKSDGTTSLREAIHKNNFGLSFGLKNGLRFHFDSVTYLKLVYSLRT